MRAGASIPILIALTACEGTTPREPSKTPVAGETGPTAAPSSVPGESASPSAVANAMPPSTATSSAPAPRAPGVPELRTFDLPDVSTKYDFRIALLPPAPSADPDAASSLGAAITVYAKGQTTPVHQVIVEDIGPAAFEESYQPELTIGDFDFDGEEDFALHVADDGPYGSPTYAVFVHRKTGDPFILSKALTELTQESMGFFDVDAKKRRIRTSSKSGCCIHWQSEYVIVAGEPRRIRTETQDALSDGCVITIETLSQDGKWKRASRPCPREEE
jgi:hypothetical protein